MRIIAVLCAVWLLAPGHAAFAQAYPTKPIRLVIHFPPGGPTDIVVLAKSRPGTINYASVGPGSPNHLGMEMLKSMAGIDMVHIPYKGTAPALTDVLAGQVSLMFNSMPSVLRQVKGGKLKGIAVGSAKRSPAAANRCRGRETR